MSSKCGRLEGTTPSRWRRSLSQVATGAPGVFVSGGADGQVFLSTAVAPAFGEGRARLSAPCVVEFIVHLKKLPGADTVPVWVPTRHRRSSVVCGNAGPTHRGGERRGRSDGSGGGASGGRTPCGPGRRLRQRPRHALGCSPSPYLTLFNTTSSLECLILFSLFVFWREAHAR